MKCCELVDELFSLVWARETVNFSFGSQAKMFLNHLVCFTLTAVAPTTPESVKVYLILKFLLKGVSHVCLFCLPTDAEEDMTRGMAVGILMVAEADAVLDFEVVIEEEFVFLSLYDFPSCGTADGFAVHTQHRLSQRLKVHF